MEYWKKRVINKQIPDNDPNGLIDRINIDKNLTVKKVSVEVNISHPFTGDLSIELTSPDGINKTLLEPSRIPGTNLSSVFKGAITRVFKDINAEGEWTIKVIDSGARDSGMLIDWTLQLELESQEETEIFINDVASLHSIQRCHQGGKIVEMSAFVKIFHSHIGDMTINLISPSGRTLLLHQKVGGSIPHLVKSFDSTVLKSFVGDYAKGLWTLKITDSLKGDTGRLVKWKLDIKTSE
ncbi:MAG: hypothetical protein HKO66_03155 [Saprospiraceae bacterium]|nr:proprotein convertase P-domain-containing protein [Bacteroidia bacterium]NNL91212.1 hypothetical protein [Saprospiraceae bacterium]